MCYTHYGARARIRIAKYDELCFKTVEVRNGVIHSKQLSFIYEIGKVYRKSFFKRLALLFKKQTEGEGFHAWQIRGDYSLRRLFGPYRPYPPSCTLICIVPKGALIKETNDNDDLHFVCSSIKPALLMPFQSFGDRTDDLRLAMEKALAEAAYPLNANLLPKVIDVINQVKADKLKSTLQSI